MKYMLLIYTDENVWAEGEREACMVESSKIAHDLSLKGQFLGASPLQPVSLATSVRVRSGKRMVTDGPFAETREQLGGYYVIDVPHLDDAITIAASLPPAAKGTVEIRPIHELVNLPKTP